MTYIVIFLLSAIWWLAQRAGGNEQLSATRQQTELARTTLAAWRNSKHRRLHLFTRAAPLLRRYFCSVYRIPPLTNATKLQTARTLFSICAAYATGGRNRKLSQQTRSYCLPKTKKPGIPTSLAVATARRRCYRLSWRSTPRGRQAKIFLCQLLRASTGNAALLPARLWEEGTGK